MIQMTVTDVAGNPSEATLTVRRGSGKLTVALSANTYQFKRSRLPRPIELTAVVTDPDGRALADAAITFTVSIPGISAITHETTTDSRGRATFETSVPRSATVGQGLTAVLVSTSSFGSVDDRTVITITK
jgi:protocatechuate 3,4-dioxygenase beta subunit